MIFMPDDSLIDKDKVPDDTAAALIAWLESNCPHSFYLFHGERKSKCIRKDCHKCWQELKESVKHE